MNDTASEHPTEERPGGSGRGVGRPRTSETGGASLALLMSLVRSGAATTRLDLERRADLGGTWDLFNYPGVRSDSDMFTLGFRFKPWESAKSIADGASIKANPASQMTARELEILRLLGRGDKIVEVADALEISYKTVANTTSLLKQKLGAKNHSDLIRIAVEMGLG